MNARLNFYLNFDGNCEEAMHYYAEIFGSEPYIFRAEDMSDEDRAMSDMDGFVGVLHGEVPIGESTIFMSDIFPGTQLTEGNRYYITYSHADIDEVRRVWKSFIDTGSTVEMELGQTFWAKLYGILIDKYGIQWMIQCWDPEDLGE
ncbi:MAG: glyoxalase/bleomycin resistance/extradiol dioxygenase family protein [Tissierellia bacterium]|nr:glyoxalase/bleomycin resistance/extradiol dioxygenase family protein [Tissierellia bacterium]